MLLDMCPLTSHLSLSSRTAGPVGRWINGGLARHAELRVEAAARIARLHAPDSFGRSHLYAYSVTLSGSENKKFKPLA